MRFGKRDRLALALAAHRRQPGARLVVGLEEHHRARDAADRHVGRRGWSPKSRYQSSSGRAGVLERLAATSVLSPMAIDCSGRSSGSTSARCAGPASGARRGRGLLLARTSRDEEQERRQDGECARGAHAQGTYHRGPPPLATLEWMAPRARCSVVPTHMTLSPLLGVVLSAVPGLGYVQATDWYEHASNPAHFQPLQLVDGNLKTAWCSASATRRPTR